MAQTVEKRGIRRDPHDNRPYAQQKYYVPRTGDGRLKRPEVRKHWQVGKVWDLHLEIARRILIGQKNVVIAEALGCCPQTVSNVRNSPVIRDKLAIMHGARDAGTIELSKRIQEFAPVCLDLLENIITGKEENASISLRAKEANNWLDRPGSGVEKVQRSENVHAHFTGDELEDIKKRAKANKVVPEAEYEVK